MKRLIFTLLVLSLNIFTTPINASEIFEPFLGAWEYRQANSGTTSGFDKEGDRLEFMIDNARLKGTYFGLSREGEHGLFYTVVEVKGIQISEERHIHFIVPERFFYAKRPRNIKQATRTRSAGFTRAELIMNGTLKDGKLILNCTSERYGCPAPVMEFRKVPRR